MGSAIPASSMATSKRDALPGVVDVTTDLVGGHRIPPSTLVDCHDRITEIVAKVVAQVGQEA